MMLIGPINTLDHKNANNALELYDRSRLLLNYLESTFITWLWEWILRPDSLPLSYMSP